MVLVVVVVLTDISFSCLCLFFLVTGMRAGEGRAVQAKLWRAGSVQASWAYLLTLQPAAIQELFSTTNSSRVELYAGHTLALSCLDGELAGVPSNVTCQTNGLWSTDLSAASCSSSSSGLDGGQIAAIVIGSLVGVLLICGLIFFVCTKMKGQQKNKVVPTDANEMKAEKEEKGELMQSNVENVSSEPANALIAAVEYNFADAEAEDDAKNVSALAMLNPTPAPAAQPKKASEYELPDISKSKSREALASLSERSRPVVPKSVPAPLDEHGEDAPLVDTLVSNTQHDFLPKSQTNAINEERAAQLSLGLPSLGETQEIAADASQFPHRPLDVFPRNDTNEEVAPA